MTLPLELNEVLNYFFNLIQRGMTALHCAVEAGLADATETLLIASADLEIREKVKMQFSSLSRYLKPSFDVNY